MACSNTKFSLGKRLRSLMAFDDLDEELLPPPPAAPSATPVSSSKTLPVFVTDRIAQSPSVKNAGLVYSTARNGRFFSFPAFFEAATTPKSCALSTLAVNGDAASEAMLFDSMVGQECS